MKEQKKVSQEIQDLIKNYKEPDLTLFISNPKTKTFEIPFVKKNESDFPRIKLTYYNFSTEKNENFIVYDYIEHLKRFGFEWIQKDLGFRYEVKINNSDKKNLKKQISLNSETRKKICIDESRIWNMKMSWRQNESA